MSKQRRRPVRRRLLRWIRDRAVILVVVLLFVFPFLVMLTTAFKTPADVFHAPPQLWPNTWTLANFATAITETPFLLYFANTVFVAGLSVLGTLVSTSLVAYSLAKIKWSGRRPLLIVVLATMMLPPQVTLIPLFVLWSNLNLTNSYVPLIVPTFLATPFLVFMIRQFMLSIPDDLLDAARTDGASELRVYWSVVLPLAKPALVTAAIFQFVWAWTDFMGPLLYLNDPSRYTLSVGLYAFFNEQGIDWGPLMAACALFTLPAALIFLVFQRFFIGGSTAGALK
jgi:multiple sugar transport system permease protein